MFKTLFDPLVRVPIIPLPTADVFKKVEFAYDHSEIVPFVGVKTVVGSKARDSAVRIPFAGSCQLVEYGFASTWVNVAVPVSVRVPAVAIAVIGFPGVTVAVIVPDSTKEPVPTETV
jgi:hypothetical protein